MKRADLNCDMGESFGAYTIGADEAVMPSITSANIACGYHAGDPGVMRRTVCLARDAGVAVGAHPGFPDLQGFGRRDLRLTPQDAEDMVLYQIGALASIARAEGVELAHVKPHGALYNMAIRDRSLADAVARAVVATDSRLALFALPNSELARAGAALNLRVALEGFADRAYEPDGSLTPRLHAGAVIHDLDIVVQRAVRLIVDGEVVATDGSILTMQVDTICVHGDTPGAATLARAIRAGLERAGIMVAAVAGHS
jgi:5-oxoprolinase (ATP-hydrolysing) subunit A